MRQLILSMTLLGLFALVVPLGLQADECKTGRLKGSYVLLATGAVDIPGLPITGPFRRVSRGIFDGNGKLDVPQSIASYNGIIFNEPFSGVYAVQPDCTVSITVNVPAPLNFPVTFAGVLSSDFRELDFTPVAPPGSALIGHLTKQRIKKCTAADLKGPYRFELQGRTVQPQPGDFVRLGRLVADGNGGFTASTDASYNGFFAHENLVGTYALDSNCIITMQYGTPNGPITLFGGLMDGGNGADLLQTSPQGAAVGGSLLRAPRNDDNDDNDE